MPLIKRRGDEGNSRSETETLPPSLSHSKARERAGGMHLTDGCIELYSGENRDAAHCNSLNSV